MGETDINKRTTNEHILTIDDVCLHREIAVAGTKYSREGLLKSPRVAIRKGFLKKVAFVKWWLKCE